MSRFKLRLITLGIGFALIGLILLFNSCDVVVVKKDCSDINDIHCNRNFIR